MSQISYSTGFRSALFDGENLEWWMQESGVQEGWSCFARYLVVVRQRMSAQVGKYPKWWALGSLPLGTASWWHCKNRPLLHVCYHTEFDRSRSNRVTKIWETWVPWNTGMADLIKTRPLPQVLTRQNWSFHVKGWCHTLRYTKCVKHCVISRNVQR